VPHPRRPFLFVIEARDKLHLLHPLFSRTVDPSDYHIIRETTAAGDVIYEALKNGDPHEKVDFAFISEGYGAGDLDKFKADVDRISGYLFTVEPYKSAKDRFNIRGVFHASPERAMDEPRQRVYRKTALNAAFNAFDLDRYMLIEEDHRMHEIAAEVPYDAIIVLVNSRRYGGGSIAIDYCVSTVDNAVSPQVLIHELGHSFAGLADEYYTSEVSYNDFYPKGVEPLEPNITALLDPANIKWKDLLSPGIAVPTEYGKEKIESLTAERRKNREDQSRAVELARKKGAGEAAVKKIEAKYRDADKAVAKKIDDVRREYASLEDKVGAFEGAGYAAKGLYRPMIYCIMISSPKGEFCRVCQQAISRMIEYFSERGVHPGEGKEHPNGRV
ncbi:MAG: M64 family metallopeptidase, partial [Candidatus Aminicenantales bacterium]